jgi:hypothetical protein
MFLLEMTYFQQSNHKDHKKIFTSMEEFLDEANEDDLSIEDIH